VRPRVRICFRRCLSLSVCLFVSLLATLRKIFWMDLHEIFREGWPANEQTIKFWWRSGSRIRIWIRVVALVRRALAEIWTVPVLLVNLDFVYTWWFFFRWSMPSILSLSLTVTGCGYVCDSDNCEACGYGIGLLHYIKLVHVTTKSLQEFVY